jgi:hypothetical protein
LRWRPILSKSEEFRPPSGRTRAALRRGARPARSRTGKAGARCVSGPRGACFRCPALMSNVPLFPGVSCCVDVLMQAQRRVSPWPASRTPPPQQLPGPAHLSTQQRSACACRGACAARAGARGLLRGGALRSPRSRDAAGAHSRLRAAPAVVARRAALSAPQMTRSTRSAE